MNEKATVLQVEQVKKRIGKRLIIKGISFDVREGEIFGFLGPNGSGKTTTIRMLVGLIKPTEGEITIGGSNIRTAPTEALQKVGCIVENPELYGFMSGWDNLEHFARMLPGVDEARIQEVTEIVGLGQRIHDKVKTYSLGMRQRLGVAQALLGRPRLLILDEPTNGLDPQGIKEMRDFIRKLAREGLSLFVSSHLLSEIQQLCDRVAIINHGEVIAVGEVDQLLHQSGHTVLWRVAPHQRALRLLRKTEGVDILQERYRTDESIGTDDEEGEVIAVRIDKSLIPQINEMLVAHFVHIYAIQVQHPTLEDLFLRMTEGERIE